MFACHGGTYWNSAMFASKGRHTDISRRQEESNRLEHKCADSHVYSC